MISNFFSICINKIKYFFMDIFYFNICGYCKKKIDNEDKKYFSLCAHCINSISYISPIKHKKTRIPLPCIPLMLLLNPKKEILTQGKNIAINPAAAAIKINLRCLFIV